MNEFNLIMMSIYTILLGIELTFLLIQTPNKTLNKKENDEWSYTIDEKSYTSFFYYLKHEQKRKDQGYLAYVYFVIFFIIQMCYVYLVYLWFNRIGDIELYSFGFSISLFLISCFILLIPKGWDALFGFFIVGKGYELFKKDRRCFIAWYLCITATLFIPVISNLFNLYQFLV